MAPIGPVNSFIKNKNKINECFGSTAQLLRPNKRQKQEHLSPITIGYLASRKGSRKAKHWKRIKILFDSGNAATLINKSLIGSLAITNHKSTNWITKAGTFCTTKKCNINFTLPALHEHREIK